MSVRLALPSILGIAAGSFYQVSTVSNDLMRGVDSPRSTPTRHSTANSAGEGVPDSEARDRIVLLNLYTMLYLYIVVRAETIRIINTHTRFIFFLKKHITKSSYSSRSNDRCIAART